MMAKRSRTRNSCGNWATVGLGKTTEKSFRLLSTSKNWNQMQILCLWTTSVQLHAYVNTIPLSSVVLWVVMLCGLQVRTSNLEEQLIDELSMLYVETSIETSFTQRSCQVILPCTANNSQYNPPKWWYLPTSTDNAKFRRQPWEPEISYTFFDGQQTSQTLEAAVKIQQNADAAMEDLRTECGLDDTANMKQCLRVLLQRLSACPQVNSMAIHDEHGVSINFKLLVLLLPASPLPPPPSQRLSCL
jgi:hypothetical protein